MYEEGLLYLQLGHGADDLWQAGQLIASQLQLSEGLELPDLLWQLLQLIASQHQHLQTLPYYFLWIPVLTPESTLCDMFG